MSHLCCFSPNPLTCPSHAPSLSLRQLAAKTSTTADEQQEIADLRAALRKAEEKGAALARELAARERDLVRLREMEEVAALKMSAVEDARARAEFQLSQAAGQLQDVQEQLSGKRKRCDELENNLSIEAAEKQQLSLQLTVCEGSLGVARQQSVDLQHENRALNARIQDLLRKMSRDSESTRKALEKAISASVRLCVVAPTVNVQVADKKHCFKSSVNQEALRQFLSTEVLKKYSFLFEQSDENAAPNGASLEVWLQAMLGQMQSSIENHVNAATNSAPGAP
ncbi:hypothetical protein B484DRAFT_455018 [Ochromonadaceae sp. CCMP2298]|nr:hypothetical protein B484DRAFT_455018 [Ochromonadaceae sp. CCMP2298]|mmetsp:Transcript_27145/g.60057  ORF Transcript_27145/g.60057 Transcript_27145/m.60057 type:complete len:282 (+) Transcript_27145:920-1765(+)